MMRVKILNPAINYDLNTPQERIEFESILFSKGIAGWSYDFTSNNLIIDIEEGFDTTSLTYLGGMEVLRDDF